MLRTRVMPCLLLKNGGLVKTIKFKDEQYIGDPLNAVRIYNQKEVDELVIFDISRTINGKSLDFALIEKIASQCFMPVCYGGGVKTLADFKENVVAIFSGFANCPDICPTTLVELKEIDKRINNKNFKVLFVTLDPDRDTQAVLKDYLASFNQSFIGLTGSIEDIEKMAQQYKIFRLKVGEGDSYTIDHSSAIYLVDKEGDIRLRYPYGFKIEGIVEDIKKLIE